MATKISSAQFFNELSNAEKNDVFAKAMDNLSEADVKMIYYLAERMVQKFKERAPRQSLPFSLGAALEILYKLGAGMAAGVIWINGAPVGEEVKNER